jgi:ubiquinone/menaquinone biosynthesis C-methylase UbiE
MGFRFGGFDMASSRSRRIEKARTLLQPGIPGPGSLWADVGCGDGIFTAALHTLIRPGGEIYGVDKSQRALQALARNFAQSYPDASIHLVQADFTRPLALPPLNGLLTANSLHFVREKRPVVVQLAGLLKPGGRLIVVEYNTTWANPAVPHPLDETGFLRLADEAGLREGQILARIPSTFLGEMYAGMARVGSATTQ